jgi:hypothetical protein
MGGRLVVVIGFDGIELVDVASVTTGFDYANRMGADPAYQVAANTFATNLFVTNMFVSLSAWQNVPEPRSADGSGRQNRR